MPRPEVSPQDSANFSETFKIDAQHPDVRIDERHLFFAARQPSGYVTRVYTEANIGGNPKLPYRAVAVSAFESGQSLPRLTSKRLDPAKPWAFFDSANTVSLMIHQYPGKDRINLSHQVGMLGDPRDGSIYVSAGVNRQTDRLDRLGLWVGTRRISTDVIKELSRGKSNPDAYLADHGIHVDREQETYQLALGDWVVTGKIKIPTEEILQTLFPEGLTKEPLEAPVEMDGWEQTDMFKTFGIEISYIPSSGVVFEAKQTPQNP